MPLKIFAIARNAFTESIRQPFFVVILLLVTGWIGFMCPALAAYTFDDDNKIMTDYALAAMLLGGLCLSAFTASGVVYNEIENRTVLTVISKPVSRPSFIVGKYLGVAAAISLAMWCWSVVFLLVIRHKVMSTASDKLDMPVIVFGFLAIFGSMILAAAANYLSNSHWGATAAKWLAGLLAGAYLVVLFVGKKWVPQAIGTDLRPDLYTALFLLLQALWLVAALALAASTRLNQIWTLLVCVVLVFLGLSSDYLFGAASRTSVRLTVTTGGNVVPYTVENTVFSVGTAGRKFFLSEVTEIRNGPLPTVVDQSGKQVDGVLTGLDAVRRVDGSEKVDLTKSGVVTVQGVNTNLASKILYRVVPNFQFTWVNDALTQDRPVRGDYVAYVSAYSALYVLAALCLATALFQTRQTA